MDIFLKISKLCTEDLKPVDPSETNVGMDVRIFYESKSFLLKVLKNKSEVALTQISVTLHYSKRKFYYKHYIHL